MPKASTKSNTPCGDCGALPARYGLAWDKEGQHWCQTCSRNYPLAVILKERYCTICLTDHESKPSCACFGTIDSKARKWCGRHKISGAINVVARRCMCGTAQPTLGKPNDTKPSWCARCPEKPSDAVNVRARKCACGVSQPSFGNKGDKKPLWCVKCKSNDAVDLHHPVCACNKCIPTFGKPDDKKATWCSACKPTDAINVLARKCECGTAQPCFGLVGDAYPRWCVACPTKIKGACDIRSRRCECGRAQPTFGRTIDERPLWCILCPNKPAFAVNVHERRICACDRKVRPCFGKPNDERATWCALCPTKPEDAIDIVNQKCECVQSWCTNFGNSRYRGNCLYCFVNLFPNEKVRNYKIKEYAFVEYLSDALKKASSITEVQLLFDKQVGGCSGRRPDMTVELFTHVVFVEIDEHQHKKGYYSACDNKRKMELFQDVGNRPTVTIRVNPDSYKNHKGIQQPSCFKLSPVGLNVIRDQQDFQKRLDVTLDRLLYHVSTIPDREITQENLYYDGFDK